jgi:hypothetical protein
MNIRPPGIFAILAAAVSAGVAWAGELPAYARAEPRQGDELTAFSDRLMESLTRAEQVRVFEGLPHPLWERDVFAAEKASVRNFSLHDALFYVGPQRLTEEHRSLFRKIWPVTVSPFRGEKLCGGFHADYALTWRDDERACAVLICFGCHEVAAFLPESDLRADLKGQGVVELRQLLRTYNKHRPAPAVR